MRASRVRRGDCDRHDRETTAVSTRSMRSHSDSPNSFPLAMGEPLADDTAFKTPIDLAARHHLPLRSSSLPSGIRGRCTAPPYVHAWVGRPHTDAPRNRVIGFPTRISIPGRAGRNKSHAANPSYLPQKGDNLWIRAQVLWIVKCEWASSPLPGLLGRPGRGEMNGISSWSWSSPPPSEVCAGPQSTHASIEPTISSARSSSYPSELIRAQRLPCLQTRSAGTEPDRCPRSTTWPTSCPDWSPKPYPQPYPRLR